MRDLISPTVVKIVVLALLTQSGSLWNLTFEQFRRETRDFCYDRARSYPHIPIQLPAQSHLSSTAEPDRVLLHYEKGRNRTNVRKFLGFYCRLPVESHLTEQRIGNISQTSLYRLTLRRSVRSNEYDAPRGVSPFAKSAKVIGYRLKQNPASKHPFVLVSLTYGNFMGLRCDMRLETYWILQSFYKTETPPRKSSPFGQTVDLGPSRQDDIHVTPRTSSPFASSLPESTHHCSL